MNKQLKEKIRDIVGEGKLYEVKISCGKIDFINTHENEFDVNRIDMFYFWKDVSLVKKSKIVSQLHEIFGDGITILAYASSYSSEIGSNYEFKRETIFNTYNNTDTTFYITDDICTYIVCTNNNKKKIKKFNTDFLGDIKIDSDFIIV